MHTLIKTNNYSVIQQKLVGKNTRNSFKQVHKAHRYHRRKNMATLFSFMAANSNITPFIEIKIGRLSFIEDKN